MLTRRLFAACALCAGAGFLASDAEAETAAPPGLKRTLIKETDGPAEGYATIEMQIELHPNATIARHTHPGIESGYVAEGGTDLTIEGQGALKLKAGDGFQVPTRTPHGGVNGPAKTIIISTYVVEKGKPLASPA
jgi:quercetin dioxygenase-like cupin family protein